MELSLVEAAALVGGEVVHGAAQGAVRRVMPIDAAEPDAITFVSKAQYVPSLASTRAACALISRALHEKNGVTVAAHLTLIAVEDPYLAFAKLAQRFAGEAPRPLGVHPSAVIEGELGPEVSVGPFVYVARGARIARGATLYAGVHVDRDASVGAGSVLFDHVVIRHGCHVGARCILHAGVVIGADGFGFAQDPDGAHQKIPQVGDVVIEDDVEIGANSCVDRGALGTTRVGEGSKLDNLVQVGHNVTIGPRSLLVAQSGVAGSSKLGRGVTLAAQAGVAGHIRVGDGALVYGQAGVTKDVAPGEKVGGTPAIPARDFFRNSVWFAKLAELAARVKKLERDADDP